MAGFLFFLRQRFLARKPLPSVSWPEKCGRKAKSVKEAELEDAFRSIPQTLMNANGMWEASVYSLRAGDESRAFIKHVGEIGKRNFFVEIGSISVA